MSKVQYLKVPVLVNGNSIRVLGEDGVPITKSIQEDKLGELTEEAKLMALWHDWVKREMVRIVRAVQRAKAFKDEWYKKTKSLAKSFNLRGKDIRTKKPKTRERRPPPRTWFIAIHGMQESIKSKAYRHAQGPWVKWANNVVKNGNARVRRNNG